MLGFEKPQFSDLFQPDYLNPISKVLEKVGWNRIRLIWNLRQMTDDFKIIKDILKVCTTSYKHLVICPCTGQTTDEVLAAKLQGHNTTAADTHYNGK